MVYNSIMELWRRRYDGGQMGFETRGKVGWSFEGLWFGGGMCLSWRKWLQYPFERWSRHKISSWSGGIQGRTGAILSCWSSSSLLLRCSLLLVAASSPPM